MSTNHRDEYGALWANHQDPLRPRLDAARAMAAEAAAKGRMPAAFDTMTWERISARYGNKKVGEALHHEIYDISADCKKILVCARSVEGTKYGIKTTGKQYFIVARHGRGLRVIEANKSISAKAAKQAGDGLGLAIDILEGRAKLSSPFSDWRRGYKAITRDEAGRLVSVWDGSFWDLGKLRTERASNDHEGGFYYYATLEECRAAAERNDIFGEFRKHDRLVFVEVEVSGREYQLGYGKRCVTHMRPLRVVEESAAAAQAA